MVKSAGEGVFFEEKNEAFDKLTRTQSDGFKRSVQTTQPPRRNGEAN